MYYFASGLIVGASLLGIAVILSIVRDEVPEDEQER